MAGLISPAARDKLQSWIKHIAALDGAADTTCEAYTHDVASFIAFMTGHFGEATGLAPLKTLTPTDMRAWMAHERARGVSARSLARELSAVKSFYRWFAERDGFGPALRLRFAYFRGAEPQRPGRPLARCP